MDTMHLYQTPSERVLTRERNAFWDRWDNEKDLLDGLQVDAMAMLTSLDGIRGETYFAKSVEEIDFLAADFAGGLHDLISNRIGRAQREADSKNIGPDWVNCDMSVFTEQVDLWLARAKARRAEVVYMTAADLGLPTPTPTKDTTNA